jgi:PQ loop repeat
MYHHVADADSDADAGVVPRLLLVGILVSYLPQHYRIISRRSSEGISPYFVLLGTTSGTASFTNILILSRGDLHCCRHISGFECFAGSLGVAQVGMQWSCFAVMLVPVQAYAYLLSTNGSPDYYFLSSSSLASHHLISARPTTAIPPQTLGPL